MAETAPKVVLVTGASSGIGKACAEHLAARSYRVFGTQRRLPSTPGGRAVEMIAMDVDDDRSVDDGVQAVVQKAGRQLPTKRRTVRAAETNDAYRAALATFLAQQAKDELAASTPEPVAELVERILGDPSPRLRYSVGMLGQRVVIPLKRILPQRLFEWALSRALSLD